MTIMDAPVPAPAHHVHADLPVEAPDHERVLITRGPRSGLTIIVAVAALPRGLMGLSERLRRAPAAPRAANAPATTPAPAPEVHA